MRDATTPRFETAAAALRFYFRVRELMADAAPPRMLPMLIASNNLPSCDGLIGNFILIGSCVDDFDEFEIWLLGELYGPTCFGARQRTTARASEAVRRRFPEKNLSLHDINRIHGVLLVKVAKRLRRLELIASPRSRSCSARPGGRRARGTRTSAGTSAD